MSRKIKFSILSINARMLRYTMLLLGAIGFLYSCVNNKKENNIKEQDSLNKIAEKHQIDSIAKAKEDSINKVIEDSINNAKAESIKNAKLKPIKNIVPTPKDEPIMMKYGVPVDFNRPIQTKYGVPANLDNE